MYGWLPVELTPAIKLHLTGQDEHHRTIAVPTPFNERSNHKVVLNTSFIFPSRLARQLYPAASAPL
ncbi:hypothetical protein SEF58_09085 [Neomoorella humiferrea]|uniref:hypothetical protein n=1 Tax=Neomoorella humiferrea TaxID=676965 RepID=UPI003D90DD52